MHNRTDQSLCLLMIETFCPQTSHLNWRFVDLQLDRQRLPNPKLSHVNEVSCLTMDASCAILPFSMLGLWAKLISCGHSIPHTSTMQGGVLELSWWNLGLNSKTTASQNRERLIFSPVKYCQLNSMMCDDGVFCWFFVYVDGWVGGYGGSIDGSMLGEGRAARVLIITLNPPSLAPILFPYSFWTL